MSKLFDIPSVWAEAFIHASSHCPPSKQSFEWQKKALDRAIVGLVHLDGLDCEFKVRYAYERFSHIWGRVIRPPEKVISMLSGLQARETFVETMEEDLDEIKRTIPGILKQIENKGFAYYGAYRIEKKANGYCLAGDTEGHDLEEVLRLVIWG